MFGMKQVICPYLSSHPLLRRQRRKKPCSALIIFLELQSGKGEARIPYSKRTAGSGLQKCNWVCKCHALVFADLLGEDALTNLPLPAAEPAPGHSL